MMRAVCLNLTSLKGFSGGDGQGRAWFGDPAKASPARDEAADHVLRRQGVIFLVRAPSRSG